MIIPLLKTILRRPPRTSLPEQSVRPVFQDYDGHMRRLPPVAGASQLELLLMMMKR